MFSAYSTHLFLILGLIEHVTVLIGISHKGKAIAGVLHQPFYKAPENPNSIGRTIWGIQGIGAFGYERSKHDGLIVITTRSHSSQGNLEAIKAMNPTEITRAGGSGYKTLSVLLGEADAYVYASKGTKRWDTCAPEAILRAAGGNMTDILGQPIQYEFNKDYMNYTGLVATMENHETLLEKIPNSVKDSLSKTL
jgi:3'(2'), 5'-bisphosphate nucleotidase